MKTSQMFPSKYLKGDDLAGPQNYKIASISQEEVGQDRELKYVAYFEGHQKGVILNKTNTDAVEALYGDDTDDWRGQEVCLFSMPVTFQGRTTNAVRIRAPKKTPPAQQRAVVAETVNDDIPPF